MLSVRVEGHAADAQGARGTPHSLQEVYLRSSLALSHALLRCGLRHLKEKKQAKDVQKRMAVASLLVESDEKMPPVGTSL